MVSDTIGTGWPTGRSRGEGQAMPIDPTRHRYPTPESDALVTPEGLRVADRSFGVRCIVAETIASAVDSVRAVADCLDRGVRPTRSASARHYAEQHYVMFDLLQNAWVGDVTGYPYAGYWQYIPSVGNGPDVRERTLDDSDPERDRLWYETHARIGSCRQDIFAAWAYHWTTHTGWHHDTSPGMFEDGLPFEAPTHVDVFRKIPGMVPGLDPFLARDR